MNERLLASRGEAVAPTLATSVLQLVAILVTAFAFAVDIALRSTCEACNVAAQQQAGFIYIGGTAAAVALSVAAVAFSAIKRRSTMAIPLVGTAITVGAYVLARSVFYS